MIHKIGFDLDFDKIPNGRFKDVIEYLKSIKYNTLHPYVSVNGLPIHFNPNYKNVGVWMSAGTDSTFLLYILARIIKEIGCDTKIYPMTVVRFWERGDWSEAAKRNVYAHIKDLFPDIIQEQQWGFLPTALEFTPLKSMDLRSEQDYYKNIIDNGAHTDVYYFNSYANYLAHKLNLSAIYNGTTTNPTTEQINEVPEFRNASDLDPESIFELISKTHYTAPGGIKKTYINSTPFKLIEKNWIVAQYDNFDLGGLFNLTRSCVETDEPEQGCGRLQCFHCEERFWAIKNKHIFLEDTHTMLIT